MSKKAELQERLEAVINDQEAIYNKATEVVDGKERGWTNDDETKYNDLTKTRSALLKQIEIEADKEQRDALKALNQRKPEAPAIHSKDAPKTFSIERATRAAITGDWDKEAGFERESMQEVAKGSWDRHKMILSPDMPMTDRADAYSVLGTAGDGGNLVGTQYRSDKFLDALWNMTILDKLPVVKNTGLTQQQSMAVSTNKVTASMVTEVASLGDSEKLTFGLKTATPKEMITKGSFSRMLDLTSAPQIRRIFNEQIMSAIAYKLDQQLLQGSGSSGEMTGILTLTSGGGADQTTTVAIGTNGGAPTYAKLVELRTSLAVDNIPQPWVFLTNAQVTSKLMTTLKDTANTNSGYIMMDGQTRLLGHDIIESQTIPSNLTKGTSNGVCSAIILGRFNETEVFQWGNVAVEFDPYTGANNSLIYVRSFSFWDMIHKRPENFAIIKDATTT